MIQADYSKIPGKIWLNGKYIPTKNANIHILSHSIHFASAVFEGIRVYNYKAFLLDKHLKRFKKSSNILDYEIPFKINKLKNICNKIIKLNNLKNGYLRPIAWRGTESMAPTNLKSKIGVAIAGWDWPVYYSKNAKLNGISLCVSNWKRPPKDTSPGESKCSGLYQICTLAKHDASRRGFDDALMLDLNSNITETTSSNIFFIKNKKIYTPKIRNFLNGITRQTVISLIKKNKINFLEKDIKINELKSFESAFITGTACEITPISKINKKKLNSKNIFILKLMNEFDKITKGK